jgi:hypothetical protein
MTDGGFSAAVRASQNGDGGKCKILLLLEYAKVFQSDPVKKCHWN